MQEERSKRVDLAKILSNTDCYTQKLENAKEIIKLNPVLTEEERTIIANDFRAVISNQRKGIRILTALAEQQRTRNRLDRAQKLEESRSTAISELWETAETFLMMIDKMLLPAAEKDTKATIFYLRTKADFIRYQCECCEENKKRALIVRAEECYALAMEKIRAGTQNPSSLSLSVALNYSVFMYEMRGKRKEAVELAQRTLDEGACFVNDGNDDEFAEVTNLQQILRKNITTWTRDENDS